jgi:hypothetical protein
MPTAIFNVTVRNERYKEPIPDRQVSADASRYLAYADQTDLFGYHASLVNTVVSEGQVFVKFQFEAPVAQESDISQFLDECETLARVESAACVTNPDL